MHVHKELVVYGSPQHVAHGNAKMSCSSYDLILDMLLKKFPCFKYRAGLNKTKVQIQL